MIEGMKLPAASRGVSAAQLEAKLRRPLLDGIVMRDSFSTSIAFSLVFTGKGLCGEGGLPAPLLSPRQGMPSSPWQATGYPAKLS